ncbi:hypothetical protein R3X25_11235 [Lutibacter sp. TH_r2]|uniref:hypothetical protein n=1 Tax=Lutibacter sp. TH_r2 TaxID=3082083 RepID=UPI002952B751|nr:hypothetical protein [Lutibacter sp. TH_r2]MDV7187855.1 hypothetical protein [Lutibacter sp. TH_r2]
MKKLMLFTLLLLSIITIKAQKTEFQDTWDIYTTPSTDNYYYYHFKKHLSSNLILSEKLSNKKKKIIVEFSLVNGVIENVKTNAANTLLKKEIIYAFNKLDFSKVSIQKNSVFHNYSLQLIEKSNGKNVLKCSASVLHETPPICYNCEKRKDFESYNLCFKNKLEKYLFENIDSTKFSELKINMQEVDKPFA